MTPQEEKAALRALEDHAITRSPHVLDGELDEADEIEALRTRARELGLRPDSDNAMRIISRGLKGIREIEQPAPPATPLVNGHVIEEPPPYDNIPPEAEPKLEPAVDVAPAIPRIEAKPYEWREPAQIRRRAWLYGRHYIRGYVSTTIGRPGLGKSALALAEVLDMASGRRILDHQERDPLRVWYIGEDPADEIERRVAAACALHRIGADEIAGRLFVNSTLDLPPLRIAEQGARGPVVNDATIGALRAEITARQIDVLVADPLIKFHSVPESDPGAMEVLMRAFSELASATNTAVETPHHTRKPAPGTAAAATVDDGRGASSIIGAVRSARVLNAMTQAEAERAGVVEGDRWRYVRIDDGKVNMKPPEAARWFQHASEILPCGESVGVAAAWQFPDAFAGFSVNDLPTVRELARTGAYRDDPRSTDWFGYAVAELIGADLDDKRDRGRISHMIKTWKKTNVLGIEMRLDAQRKEKAFIVPGPLEPMAEAAE